MLISLRQPTITATPVTDAYQLLALEFFNQIKQQVEDATNWRSLYQTINVTVPAGQLYAVIPGTNERTRVVRQPVKGAGMSQAGYAPALMPADAEVALCFDVTAPSVSGQYPLTEMPLHLLLYNFTNQNGSATLLPQPQFFALGQGNADNGLLGQNEAVLYIYPPCTSNRTVQITLCVPQSDFSATLLEDSNSNTNILVPTYPILQGLQWLMRAERGEELSVSNAYSEDKFNEVLDDAVGIEEAEKGNELDLVIV